MVECALQGHHQLEPQVEATLQVEPPPPFLCFASISIADRRS